MWYEFENCGSAWIVEFHLTAVHFFPILFYFMNFYFRIEQNQFLIKLWRIVTKTDKIINIPNFYQKCSHFPLKNYKMKQKFFYYIRLLSHSHVLRQWSVLQPNERHICVKYRIWKKKQGRASMSKNPLFHYEFAVTICSHCHWWWKIVQFIAWNKNPLREFWENFRSFDFFSEACCTMFDFCSDWIFIKFFIDFKLIFQFQ